MLIEFLRVPEKLASTREFPSISVLAPSPTLARLLSRINFPRLSSSAIRPNTMNGDGKNWSLNDDLEVAAPEVLAIIQREKGRQRRGLEMIASENFTSRAVLQCMSSVLHNKYSEGQPGAR